jgi:hypothetical protein
MVYSIVGIQRIVKIVKPHENTGRVYLPKEWIGEEVEIVRTGVKVE